jgi:hypothetical protein
VRIIALALAAFLLLANTQCLLACERAPVKSRGASSCHPHQQPEPDSAPQSCAAQATVKADLVETGSIAHAAARNVEIKAPESRRETVRREPPPCRSLDAGLFTVLKI